MIIKRIIIYVPVYYISTSLTVRISNNCYFINGRNITCLDLHKKNFFKLFSRLIIIVMISLSRTIHDRNVSQYDERITFLNEGPQISCTIRDLLSIHNQQLNTIIAYRFICTVMNLHSIGMPTDNVAPVCITNCCRPYAVGFPERF